VVQVTLIIPESIISEDRCISPVYNAKKDQERIGFQLLMKGYYLSSSPHVTRNVFVLSGEQML